MAFRPDVEADIAAAAQRYGVPLSYMRNVARVESGGDPNASNGTAGGLFQFTNGTAKRYGLSDKFDPAANADAAARLARDNYQGLSSALGRPPTDGELYLAHQQGLGGATKMLTNPNAPAVNAVGSGAITSNGGSAGMTGGDYASMWSNKLSGTGGSAPVSLTAGDGSAAPVTSGIGSLSGVTLPTTSAAQAATTDAAADPMSGIFTLLAAGTQQQQAPVPEPQMMQRRQAPEQSIDQKMAETSQTPNVYYDRLRMQQNG